MDYCNQIPINRNVLQAMYKTHLKACRLEGGAYTESATAPINPEVGDYWFRTGQDRLYKFIVDGDKKFWLQISN